jgi:putative methionine-R-sulfoxide reductase with GAF domain
MELNFICHLYRIVGFIINGDQLLNWVGIYLYLVTAKKTLTKFKSNAQP